MSFIKPANERQQEIYDMCLQYLYDHENPQVMIKNAPLYKEGYDAFGLSDAEQRELRQMVLDRFNPSPQEIADLGKIFLSTHKFEFGLLAVQLIKKHRPRVDRYVYEAVFEWLEQGIENIAHADLLATKITPVFLELGIASLDDFETWRTAPSKWTRRVAALTMLYLRDKASPERLLEYIQPLLKDPEKVVQQGVGIFLRELWALHSDEVEEFLLNHRDNTAPTVMQYATEHMQRDKKKRFGRAAMNRPPQSGNQPRKQNQPQNKRQNPNQRNNAQPKPNSPHHAAGRVKPLRGRDMTPPLKKNNNKKNKLKPNVIVPEVPEMNDDNIPDWDSFDDKF